MNRDERKAFIALLVTLCAGAVVVFLLYLWLSWRFVAGMLFGAFGDTLAYGLVLLRQRLWKPPMKPPMKEG
jgi:hypothetical protein